MSYPCFPILPDDQDIIERIEWLTDINESWSGEEQRIKLRELPRRAVEFGFKLLRYDRSLTDAMLWQNVYRHDDPTSLLKWTVPFWWDLQLLTGDLDAEDTNIPCTTENYAFVAGGKAVIISATRLYDRKSALTPDDYEVVTISAVNADSIDIDPDLDNGWSEGDYIIPAGTGILAGEIAIDDQSLAGKYFTGRARLQCDPESINVEGVIMTAFNDYKIFPIETMNQISSIFEDALLAYDNLTGTPNITRRRLYPPVLFNCQIEFKTRAEIQDFRDYIDEFEGRWQPFWLPSWNHDIRPVSEGTTQIIHTREFEYTAYNDYDEVPTSSWRYFALFDGSTLYPKTISDIDDAGSDVIDIIFGTAAPGNIDVDTYELICFIHFVRMMQDGFDIYHSPNGTARCSFGAVKLHADFATG